MKTPDKIDAFITVITVVNYKSELIQEFLFRLNEMMPDNFVDYEILTIDIESASDAENLMSNILIHFLKFCFSQGYLMLFLILYLLLQGRLNLKTGPICLLNGDNYEVYAHL